MKLFNVFVKAPHVLIVPDEEASFETVENVEAAGFALVWDSAPSEFNGVKYAAENYGAFLPVTRSVVV